jgi:hypothetical protein
MKLRPHGVGLMQECGLLLLYLAMAIVMTWPLARLLPTAVAYPGDPLINSFILAWDAHAIATAPADIYSPNLFFPAPYALTFSENLFGLWPLAAMLLAFTTPLAAHNVLLIAGIAFSAYGASVLGRIVTQSVAGGMAAGITYGFCAWRFVHLSHLQHAWGGWLALLLAAIIYYDRRRTTAAAVLVCAAFVLNGLTNLHYLVFAVVLSGIAIILLITSASARRQAPYLLRLVGALGVATLIVAVVLWPYRSAHRMYETRGDRSETMRYSATPGNWLSSAEDPEPERRVFPGYAFGVVSIIGLVLAWRRSLRIWGLLAAACIVIGVIFSLGPNTTMYSLLFDHSMLFKGIRAPARWAVLVYLGMAVLSAIAVRGRLVAAVAVGALCVAPVFSAPIRWYLMPPDVSSVDHWLRDTPLKGGVLELPIGDRDFYYLLGAAFHHKPIVNGASGGAPPMYITARHMFSQPEVPDGALDELKRRGVAIIVAHSDALRDAPHVRQWLRNGLERRTIGYVGRFEAGIFGDYVFAIGRSGRPMDDELAAFLDDRGTIPNNQHPFGYLEMPLPNHEANGELEVRGWALSGSGIRRVRLWFANKACYADAELSPYPGLQKVTRHHSVESARFAARLPRRPCGRPANDILVELTDHAGRSTTLPHVWFQWN